MLPIQEKIARQADISFKLARRADRAFGFEWHQHPEVELTLHAATRWAADSDGPVAYAFSSWLREDGSFHGPTGVRLHPLLSAEARAELEGDRGGS